MAEKKSIYIYGHSFPARFLAEARRCHMSVAELLGISQDYNVYVEGHPGLSYDRIFNSPDHYFQRLQAQPTIHLLCIDMGTNDLSNTHLTPSVVVSNTLRFLDALQERGIQPRRIVFLSVIQRSRLNRPNQVSLQNFNHRARRFNRSLNRALVGRNGVCLCPQRRINHPRHMVDGCHLSADGMVKYVYQLRWLILHYSAMVQSD